MQLSSNLLWPLKLKLAKELEYKHYIKFNTDLKKIRFSFYIKTQNTMN